MPLTKSIDNFIGSEHELVEQRTGHHANICGKQYLVLNFMNLYQKYLNVTLSQTQQHATNNLETAPFAFLGYLYKIMLHLCRCVYTQPRWRLGWYLGPPLSTTTIFVHSYCRVDLTSMIVPPIGALCGEEKNNLCILIQRFSIRNGLLWILSHTLASRFSPSAT